MQVIDEGQKKQVVKTWNEIASEIEDVFGFSPHGLPSQITLTSEESDLSDFTPGVLESDSIVINSRIEKYEDLLPITITKLCFQSALPSDLLCDDCIEDLSFEFARRRIEDSVLRSRWESLWSEHTPPRQVSKVIEYHPCAAYIWLHSVAGDNGLDTFVRELTHRARNQIPLSFDEYLRYFSMRIRRFENTLDSTELKIVRYLVEKPDLQFNDLAKLVGVSQEWVSRKISQLQKRMILRRFDRVPFSRIGIRMLHLLMARGTSNVDSFSLVKDCPFLFSFRKVVSGDWDSLATLCIPDNPQSMQHLDEGLNLIERLGLTIESHWIISSGISHCFDYYSTKEKQWNLPWELLTIHLQRIISDDLASSMPRVDTPEQKLDVHLDDLAIRILDCVRKGVSSVSKIRNELKVGQHRVADELHRLRENELIVKMWEPHNIGLSEHVVVFTKDRAVGRTIAAWSLRIPRSIISFSSDDELMLLAELPRGGSYGLASAMGEIESNVSVSILSPSTYGSWRFPVTLWDSNYQKWQCPENEVKKWISDLKCYFQETMT
jgi:DNA-binding HxlR family transcriptional regulator